MWTDRGCPSVAVSPTFASPLPVQGIEEARGITLELDVRGVPVDREVLRREPSPSAGSGADLHILDREHDLREVVRVNLHQACAFNLTTTTTGGR